MKYVIEVDRSELISKVSDELKKIEDINPPEWSKHVKTGAHKERAPAQADWWHMRAASMLVKTAFMGPIGVAKLRTAYGGKKRRGHKPAEFRKAAGSILRHVFQQLEKCELVRQTEKGVHKGRVLTPKGTSLLNTVAKSIVGSKHPVKKSKPQVEAKVSDKPDKGVIKSKPQAKDAKANAKKGPQAEKPDVKDASKSRAKAQQITEADKLGAEKPKVKEAVKKDDMNPEKTI